MKDRTVRVNLLRELILGQFLLHSARHISRKVVLNLCLFLLYATKEFISRKNNSRSFHNNDFITYTNIWPIPTIFYDVRTSQKIVLIYEPVSVQELVHRVNKQMKDQRGNSLEATISSLTTSAGRLRFVYSFSLRGGRKWNANPRSKIIIFPGC